MAMDLDPGLQRQLDFQANFTADKREALVEWIQNRVGRRPHHRDMGHWCRDNGVVSRDFDSEGFPRDLAQELLDEAVAMAESTATLRAELCAEVMVPGFGLPLTHMPPAEQHFPILLGIGAWDWKGVTLTNREVCMMKMMEDLTNKANWWDKVFDHHIADKWKAEALQMDWASYRHYADFTPAMAEAVIAELRQKAELYKQTGLIPIFDYSSCAIKSDKLIPEDLRTALREAVQVLEDVPSEKRDWHPGSTHKVLDLVHPSLWPLIYGRTPVLLDRRIGLHDALASSGTGTVLPAPMPLLAVPPPDQFTDGPENWHSTSFKFQWLPCDVALDPETGAARIDSYINNLHPEDHAAAYPVIERFIEKALPAWDVVYRWPTEFATQRLSTRNASVECNAPDACNWECQPWNRPPDEETEGGERDENAPYTIEYRDSELFRKDREWFARTHPIELPDAKPGDENNFKLKPGDVRKAGFFGGKSRLQVIVKLANVHLTPEDPEFKFQASEDLAKWYMTDDKEASQPDQGSDAASFEAPASEDSEGSPVGSDALTSEPSPPRSMHEYDYQSLDADNDTTEYEGGSWHTEGMLNERICATALFYYDSHNITDCHLDFKTACNGEGLETDLNYGQSQHEPIRRVFDVDPYRDAMQHIGGVLTTNSPSTGDDETRAVFFPNLLQHRVSPFRLADPEKPGHRKILALFLVDPAVPVLSTANVPPQQRHWWDRQVNIEERLAAQRLPHELTRMVLDEHMDGFPISEEEAKKIRLELMAERSTKQDGRDQDLRWHNWNFCEH